MNPDRIIARAVLLLAAVAALLPAAVWAARTDSTPADRRAADEQQIIEPAEGLLAGGFGGAIALDGDTLAVGAKYYDLGDLGGQGAVYLFERDAAAPTGWAEVGTLHDDPPVELAFFGQAVALDGDTLVVGSPSENGNIGFAQGGAYVYERDEGGPGNWGRAAALADEKEAITRFFGGAVAVSGDLIAVGAWGAEGNRGRVYLYDRAAGWARVKSFSDPNGQPFDHFGAVVALEGDTLVVGANQADHDPTTPDTGVVFVYRRDHGGAGNWGLVRRLTAGTPQEHAAFGLVLALDDDRLLVGAPNEDRDDGGNVTVNAGAAYLYKRDEGGPEAWGLEAALRPAGGGVFDMFGGSVALAGDRLWIAAPNSPLGGFEQQGIVHPFERVGGAWEERPVIEAADGSDRAHFGGSLAVWGEELAIGAPDRQPNGAVYLVDAAAAPPRATAAYLPVVVRDGPPPTGTLQDGGSLHSPSGAIIGALPGSLGGPVDATIAPTSPPAVGVPPGLVTRGDYYQLSARTLTIMPHDKPLLVGLPVPAGADPARLAAAVLLPSESLTDQTEPAGHARSWATAPGRYDAPNGLFVFTVGAMLPEGVTLVLFEHTANEPLPEPAARAAQAALYSVRCDPTRPHANICDQANRTRVAAELEAAHREYVDDLGFRQPRLVRLAGRFVGAQLVPVAGVVTYHGAVIAQDTCADSNGKPMSGQYSFAALELLVCFNSGTSPADIRRTVRHELFHAIQASYTQLTLDRDAAGLEQTDWLVEGTATAAEESGVGFMARSPLTGLRRASDPLLDRAEGRAYAAQDFWVYVGLQGLQGDNGLGYLRPILEQGATPEHADNAMNVGDAYWAWAKNQIFEHYQTMGGAFSVGECEFDTATYDGQAVKLINYPTKVTASGTLPPLTSAIVQITTTMARDTMPVGANTTGDRQNLRFKVYRIGEPACWDKPDGPRVLNDLPEGALRYVIVSNVSLTDDLDYTVWVD